MPEQNRPYSYAIYMGEAPILASVTRNGKRTSSPFADLVFFELLDEKDRRELKVAPFDYGDPVRAKGRSARTFEGQVQHYNWDVSYKNTFRMMYMLPRVLAGVLNQPGRTFPVAKQTKWQAEPVAADFAPQALLITRFVGSSGQTPGVKRYPFAYIQTETRRDKDAVESVAPTVLALLNHFEELAFKRETSPLTPVKSPRLASGHHCRA